jgi:hypothetical protein
MAGQSVWRRHAPIWLRLLAGILIFPIVWLGLASICQAMLAADVRSTVAPWALIGAAIVAGIACWLIVKASSGRATVALLAVALVGIVWMSSTFLLRHSSVPQLQADLEKASPSSPAPLRFEPLTPMPPQEGAALGAAPPALIGPPEKPTLFSPAWSSSQPAPAPEVSQPTPSPGAPASPPSLPQFPWPPPSASASYVLPDVLFRSDYTVGQVVTALLSALESSGYVERSFFLTPPGGVVLVTRLERISGDGAPAPGERWPNLDDRSDSTESLLQFLQGLFYVDPGHYRVIAFILQDFPFSQSAQSITAPEARLWLSSGANILPPEISSRLFSGGHCTVLVYEFASDGTKVRAVMSSLTGKQHLEKAGFLSALAKIASKY